MTYIWIIIFAALTYGMGSLFAHEAGWKKFNFWYAAFGLRRPGWLLWLGFFTLLDGSVLLLDIASLF